MNTPFENSNNRKPGAVINLEYYGAVASPVIDDAPNPPIVFVTSACTPTFGSTAVSWYLDAIDLKTHTILNSQLLSDGTKFLNSNQLSRAALLMTHPSSGGNYLYVAFGEGVSEVKASEPTDGYEWAYSGVVFGYTSPFVTFTALTGSPFYDNCVTKPTSCPGSSGSGTFPSVYTLFSSPGATPSDGPSCDTGLCDHGDNWAVNGAGIWMSGKGPASDASANVYLAAGNGPFACNDVLTSECTDATAVYYWGESAFKLPAGSATAPMAPTDFFAPYKERYTLNMTTGDASPALYQTKELSRLDQDFGTSGVILIPHTGLNLFSAASDKTGYLYTMPAGANSLGKFKKLDAGLTGGTVTTQLPFQLSRLPTTLNQTVCPVNNDTTGTFVNTPCDEVHELAWFNDYLFVWPVNESVEVFSGSFSNSNNTYSFGTSPSFDPCLTANNCTPTIINNNEPPFPPASQGGAGGAMAIALGTSTTGTLWGVVPQTNAGGSSVAGSLYGYSIDATGILAHLWDNISGHNCSAPPASGWFTPSFTEPTLASGAVYVPTYCAVTGGHYGTCQAASLGGNVISGVLVFKTCP